jgi:murein DD-endopeptidase MepM/ murein hydrolase activator NlpD
MNSNSKIRKFAIALGISVLVLANTALGFAAEGDFKASVLASAEEAILMADLSTETLKTAPSISEQEIFLNRLRQELNLSKTDYRQLLKQISETKVRLDLVSEEKLSLDQQLQNLDSQIDLTSEQLFSVLQELVQRENEVTLLGEEIEITEIVLAEQKEVFRDYLRLMYQEEKSYFYREDDGSLNALKLLLADESVGQNLRKLEYLELLNQTGQQLIERLDGLEMNLTGNQKALEVKMQKLDTLLEEFSAEKIQLELQKESRQRLLKVTSGQEEVYADLLEQTIGQQEELIHDIKALSDTLNFIELKVDEEGADFDPSAYEDLLDERDKALFDFHLQTLEYSACEFMWPVEPDKGISAFFRDSGYAGVFGMQHNAVDIPEYQGSAVRAAADAIVYTVRDNGYGYNYIILAHPCGLMTVYGHVNKILVSEGDMIPRGTIIALSGGMPGTLGAGYMTTGPHLHLEVLLNGQYVDPLRYLNLGKLTEKHISELPDKYRPVWEAALLADRGRLLRGGDFESDKLQKNLR